MTSRPNVPAICPLRKLRSPVGRFPSAGSSGASSPDLTGTISRLRFLVSPRASLRFLRSALPPLRRSSLPRGATTPRGPGLLLPRRPRRLSSVEKTRPPRFLDNPCVHAPLSDPGGPPTPGHYSAGDGVFRTDYYVDSAMMLISGLNHAACTLPVYASRPRSPQDAQHSVPAGGQPWPGRTLACGVAQKVSAMSIPLHGILLHQALPGAQSGQLHITNNQCGCIVAEGSTQMDVYVENDTFAAKSGGNTAIKNQQGFYYLGTVS